MESDVTHLEKMLKLWAWFEANKKQVKLGAIIVAVLAVVISIFVWQRSEKERKAGEALSDVFVPLAMAAPNARVSGVDGYQKVALAYPNHEAGAQAMLLAATGLFGDGKFKEALAEFDAFARQHPESALIGQTLLGRAACFDALNQTNEAATAYKTLIDQHPTEPMIPQAKFALARLYEAQGKLEQARNYYEEVGNNRYSSIGSEAGIRLEELLQKHPELVPSTPSLNPAAKSAPTALVPAPKPTAAPANAPTPAPKVVNVTNAATAPAKK